MSPPSSAYCCQRSASMSSAAASSLKMSMSPGVAPFAALAGPLDEKSAPADRAAPANPKVFRKPGADSRFVGLDRQLHSCPGFFRGDKMRGRCVIASHDQSPFLVRWLPDLASQRSPKHLRCEKYPSRSHRAVDAESGNEPARKWVGRCDGPRGCSVDPAFIEAPFGERCAQTPSLRRAFGQSPSVAWISASAATAAVSARKMRGPRSSAARAASSRSRRARHRRSRPRGRSAGRGRRPRSRERALERARLIASSSQNTSSRPAASLEAPCRAARGAISGVQISRIARRLR